MTMDDVTGAIEMADGTVLFTRRWPVEDPRAIVLLVHGLGEHSGRYGHVGAAFAARGLELRAFDLRGHGRSGAPRLDVADFDVYQDDLAAMVGAEVEPEGSPWVLYGHSMGGLIAARYLAEGAVQPDAAVLSAPALDADVPGALRLAVQVLGRVTPGIRLPNSITGDQLSRDPAVGEAYFADPLVETKATARFGRALLAEQERVRAMIDRITVPTLVIHGAEDPLVPPRASAPLAGVPAVERRLLPGLRHEVHNEPERDEVLRSVIDWIGDRLDAQPAA